MAYATAGMIGDRLPKFKGQIDADKINVEPHLTRADVEIDGRLGAIYKTPFDPVPPMIAQLAADLAAYFVALAYLTTVSAEENGNILALHRQADSKLTRLAEGKMHLAGVEKITTVMPAPMVGGALYEGSINDRLESIEAITTDYTAGAGDRRRQG